MSRQGGGKKTLARTVGHSRTFPRGDMPRVERLLADAKRVGTVLEHGTGSTLAWFNGPPGPEMRALVRAVGGRAEQ